LSDLNQDFKVTPLFDAKYISQTAKNGHFAVECK